MSDNELWYVKTADGDVDRMTLDELDEAFNAGRIDENVTVLPAGQQNWVRLGVLLGLDAAPPPAHAPLPMTPTAFAMPQSIRPVSLDLSDMGDDPFAPKKSRKGKVFGSLLAVVAVAGGIFAATRAAGHVNASAATAAIVVPPAAPPSPPPPAVDPTPAPPPAAAPIPDHGLTDAQKQALAAQDKVREDKAKARKKGRGFSGGGGHQAKYKSQGFTTGGNKYDPLNANL